MCIEQHKRKSAVTLLLLLLFNPHHCLGLNNNSLVEMLHVEPILCLWDTVNIDIHAKCIKKKL